MLRALQVPSVKDYITNGPSSICLYHPALGPLWHVIQQKLQGGGVDPGSEVVLEVAELCWKDVHVSGSFLVHAD